MESDGSNQTRLTYNANGSGYTIPYDPQFSPDGTQIVFGLELGEASGIYVIDVDGTNQTRLTNIPEVDYVMHPRYSPNGSKIVFESSKYGDKGIIYMMINIMDVDGSNLKGLTNNTKVNNDPQFSPDGSKILFVLEKDDNNYDIYIMDIDGSNQRNLTE